MKSKNMRLQTERVTGKRILLVEDERAVREALRVMLSLDAHTVVEANNGAEAFALFRSDRFDLVVTDFEMPFVKGNELASRIKQLAPQQPVLMITAFAHRPNFDNPVDAVLAKPFNSKELSETMAELLSSRGNDHGAAPTGNQIPGTQMTETEVIAA